MGAYGFNEDKSRYDLHIAPKSLATFQYNSQTETAAAFWGRMFTKAKELFSIYGENLKIRMSSNSLGSWVLDLYKVVKNTSTNDITNIYFAGTYMLDPNPTQTGTNDSLDRYVYALRLYNGQTNAMFFMTKETIYADTSKTNKLEVTKLGDSVNNGYTIFDFEFIA